MLSDLKSQKKVGNGRINIDQVVTRDQMFLDYQRKRRRSVEKVREKINETLRYLENNDIKCAEQEFKGFCEEHYKLTVDPLKFYELYAF